VVAAAQYESKQRNARLLAEPRRNEYVLHHDRPRPSDVLEGNGTVSKPVSDGTGVNATVGAALALVAEAGVKNKTAVKLDKRGGSYWMENVVHNGASPYAPAGYKVTFVLSLVVSPATTNTFALNRFGVMSETTVPRVMVSTTTRMPSTRPSATATDAARTAAAQLSCRPRSTFLPEPILSATPLLPTTLRS
jgi:hypothetical protein